jgi:hypothetical protein
MLLLVVPMRQPGVCRAVSLCSGAGLADGPRVNRTRQRLGLALVSATVGITCLLPATATTAGDSVTLTSRLSSIHSTASGDGSDDTKAFHDFGSWSDSVSSSGDDNGCGEPYSADGKVHQTSRVSGGGNKAVVNAEGRITAETSGSYCGGPPSAGGQFQTQVEFTIAGDPVPYSATGKIGPLGSGFAQLALLNRSTQQTEFDRRDGGDFSLHGKLDAGSYQLRFFVGISGQSVDSASSLDFQLGKSSCDRVKKGTGYAGLTGEMKAALGRLYDALDAVDACYRFNIGARSQEYQDNLRARWHAIADRPQGDTRSAAKIARQLKEAGFAQAPTGYKAPNQQGLRVAEGGPAVRSRHTAGQAADLTVKFPTERNLAKFQAAARQAGLCGPPTKDPVHVELPYKRKDKAHPHRRLFRCHFPEGPAP